MGEGLIRMKSLPFDTSKAIGGGELLWMNGFAVFENQMARIACGDGEEGVYKPSQVDALLSEPDWGLLDSC